MNIPLSAKIRVEFDCPDCNGTGHGEVDIYCKECGDRPTQDELKDAMDTMPCGHSWDSCVEEDCCAECEGEGKQVQLITLEQLRGLLTAEPWEATP